MATITRIKSILVDLNQPQAWLAEKAGLSPTRLSRIIHGARVAEDEVERVAAVLGLPAAEIIDSTEPILTVTKSPNHTLAVDVVVDLIATAVAQKTILQLGKVDESIHSGAKE